MLLAPRFSIIFGIGYRPVNRKMMAELERSWKKFRYLANIVMSGFSR
ncbi:MAG: hypothetical protein GY820_22945 [Gammaproteobacteria bacterium]|nr:hypothetical protein [Gammaproteobacteria bacterium]